MAKKRKKEEPESYEWVPPEFNEKEFLENDIRVTKGLMWSTILAIVFGALDFAAGSVSLWLGGIVYLAGAVLMIKVFPKVPLFSMGGEKAEKKNLAGNLALFMLLSLGIWILFMNPPFSS